MATKIVHRLQLPYATPEWPFISKEDESAIVQLLVDLLKPIGDHRRSHVIPSKGKHRKKRKLEEQDQTNDGTERYQIEMPAALDYSTIGFNSTVRSLETMSKRSKPAALKDPEDDIYESGVNDSDLGAVFVCRSALPDPITASIPLLIATASLAKPENPPIRLIQVSANVESQLAKALHQPRVGFVGLRIDTPRTDVLLALVRAAVVRVRVPWLDGTGTPRYLPVQIESTETLAGLKEKPSQTSSTPPRIQLKGKDSKAGLLKGRHLKGEPLRAEPSKGKAPNRKPQSHSS